MKNINNMPQLIVRAQALTMVIIVMRLQLHQCRSCLRAKHTTRNDDQHHDVTTTKQQKEPRV
jgi:multimeric flavodoxin WrbA